MVLLTVLWSFFIKSISNKIVVTKCDRLTDVDVLESLKNLSYIRIYSCSIENVVITRKIGCICLIEIMWCYKLKNLVILADVKCFYVESCFPIFSFGAIKIDSLKLRQCNLKDMDVFRVVRGLRKVELCSCKELENIDGLWKCELKNLKIVGCGVKRVREFLNQCMNLKSLEINLCYLEGEVKGLRGLTKIKLWGYNVDDEDDESLEEFDVNMLVDMIELESVELSFLDIKGVKFFVRLRKLRKVRIGDDCTFDVINLEDIKSLEKDGKINLSWSLGSYL